MNSWKSVSVRPSMELEGKVRGGVPSSLIKRRHKLPKTAIIADQFTRNSSTASCTAHERSFLAVMWQSTVGLVCHLSHTVLLCLLLTQCCALLTNIDAACLKRTPAHLCVECKIAEPRVSDKSTIIIHEKVFEVIANGDCIWSWSHKVSSSSWKECGNAQDM